MIPGRRKILFHGSECEGTSAQTLDAYCREIAYAVVENGCSVLLSGPGALDLSVAEYARQACEKNGRSPAEAVHWYFAGAASEQTNAPDPRIGIGSRFYLRLKDNYGSFARLRTCLVEKVDAVITVGGRKGVQDVIEKAMLARRPFFPVAVTGGASLD